MKKTILSAIGLFIVLGASAQEPDSCGTAKTAEAVPAAEPAAAQARSVFCPEMLEAEKDSEIILPAVGEICDPQTDSADYAPDAEICGRDADSVLFARQPFTTPVAAAAAGNSSVLKSAEAALPDVRSASQRIDPKSSRHFLPMRRRIDREISRGRFAYKGELMIGLTASYGTMSSDDTDFMVILENINLDGTIATVKPFIGYFYRDNRCVGVRFGYEHMDGHLGNVDLDLGEQNDISLNIANMSLDNDNYSFALFHRSYVGLDHKGRFGLFAEVEASAVIGSGSFINNSGDSPKATYSDNLKLKLAFNPGVAVYIFPNVCATVSLGLGGIQYNSVTQRDAEGNKTGSRTASKMRFRLNIADINFGMVVHFWDKGKR